ncbi:hypothetical protein MUK42_25961 [Musa troglodytarum]|uniref:Uncharacterized protein n=1 Tax=Musa troglodytarum TaxID=320322 RepID=A0A9E7FTE0_9LILI|nr:hypothetical protein MUK42_25961 [Musa troglodytarum]
MASSSCPHFFPFPPIITSSPSPPPPPLFSSDRKVAILAPLAGSASPSPSS